MGTKTLREFHDESEGRVFSIKTASQELVYFIPDRWLFYDDKKIKPSEQLAFRGIVVYYTHNKTVSIFSNSFELWQYYNEEDVTYHDNLGIYMVLKDE